MFAKGVGSNPTLPTYSIYLIYAFGLIALASIKSTVSNLLAHLKEYKIVKRMWFSINSIVLTLALCAACRELA